MPETTPEVDEIAKEAKSGFNLISRLQNIPQNTAIVTIYTDNVAGRELGYAKTVPDELNQYGVVITPEHRERAGVLGEIDSDDGSDDAKSAALDKKAAALRKKLARTSLVFNLRAVPTIIIRDATRKTKQSLGIKGKNIPEDKQEEWGAAYSAHILASVVQSFTDTESGETNPLTFEGAKALRDFLPTAEYDRLDGAIVDLQFRNSIDESATAEADF